MKARLFIAALDWNSQTREEAKDEQGNVKEKLVWSKRRGKWVKRIQYVSSSENHIGPLLQMIIECSQQGTKIPEMKKPILPKHVAKEPKPKAEDVIRKSRFTNMNK